MHFVIVFRNVSIGKYMTMIIGDVVIFHIASKNFRLFGTSVFSDFIVVF